MFQNLLTKTNKFFLIYSSNLLLWNYPRWVAGEFDFKENPHQLGFGLRLWVCQKCFICRKSWLVEREREVYYRTWCYTNYSCFTLVNRWILNYLPVLLKFALRALWSCGIALFFSLDVFANWTSNFSCFLVLCFVAGFEGNIFDAVGCFKQRFANVRHSFVLRSSSLSSFNISRASE